MVFSSNLIDQIIKNQSLLDRWERTAPLLIMAVFSYCAYKKPKISGYIYAVISILSLLTTQEPGDLTGAGFMALSIAILRIPIIAMIMSIIIFISISTKIFFGFSGNQMMVLFLGNIYYLLIHYILFHPKPKLVINRTPPPPLCPKPDYDIIEIMQRIIEGELPKQIAPDYGITESGIHQKLSRAASDAGAKNVNHYKAMCQESDYIGLKLTKPKI